MSARFHNQWLHNVVRLAALCTMLLVVAAASASDLDECLSHKIDCVDDSVCGAAEPGHPIGNSCTLLDPKCPGETGTVQCADHGFEWGCNPEGNYPYALICQPEPLLR
jgi:hypothetical protein